MTAFALQIPPRILFGRNEAAKAPKLITAFGSKGVVVHGANPARAAWLLDGLAAEGCTVHAIACAQEPTLAMLESALADVRDLRPNWVAALGGGQHLIWARRLLR